MLRHFLVEIEGKKVLLLPEFELTDYPPKHPLSLDNAAQMLENYDADIKIAGFVEENASKRYSSCIVLDDKNIHITRKYLPDKTEKDILDPSFERPNFLNLSIGKTVILLCSDAKIFVNDDIFICQSLASDVRNVLLVSAWLNNFDKATPLMSNLTKRLNLRHCYIIDRFHGLKRIT